jgi:LmbE family N-acetylglucosaminyl deacetylase
MTLVVVGAHALDAELMAGPLAAVASDAGWPVVLVHLTLGERGHTEKPAEVFGRQIREESLLAGHALGAEVVWSGAPAPLRGADVLDWLVAELERRRPSLVVTHWKGSWHPSHREANEVVGRALEQIAPVAAPAFGENCEDLVGFAPTHLIPMASVRDRWLGAVNAYELFRRSVPGSEVEAPIPYWAYYTAAFRVHGLQFDVGQAQVFMSEGPLPADLGFRPIPDA